MVLLIVAAITILATGFLAGADMELACGGNTLLRVEMDQLAQSGIEHVRGLILHPQEVPASFWTNGATGQQLVGGTQDYYDVGKTERSDPGDYCTYDIKCVAYRKLTDGTKTGQSRLEATLRLDPCVALGVGVHTTLWNAVAVHGDAYCKNGSIDNGRIYGDVLAAGSTGFRTGQLLRPETLPSDWWPPVTVDYSNPDPIWRYVGDRDITETATISGMLLVDGNLTIRHGANGSQIIATKNLPALYVRNKLEIEDVDVRIEGLVVVGGDVQIHAGASITITGALFVGGTLNGLGSTLTIIADPMKAAIVRGAVGSQTTWSPAAGGFFKSIRRWE
jgi:hypothetical protein